MGDIPRRITVPAKAEGKGLLFNLEVCLPLSAERLALINEAGDLMAQVGITSIQNADPQGQMKAVMDSWLAKIH